jgi:hypothetical protein
MYAWKRCIVVAIFALTINTGMAWADTSPAPIGSSDGCTSWVVCDGQTATGPCTVEPATGDEIVAKTKFANSLTFDGGRSTGTYSCDFYANTQGYDASSGVGTKINSVPLTETQEMLSYSGVFDQIWVECTAIATNVTVVLNSCPR